MEGPWQRLRQRHALSWRQWQVAPQGSRRAFLGSRLLSYRQGRVNDCLSGSLCGAGVVGQTVSCRVGGFHARFAFVFTRLLFCRSCCCCRTVQFRSLPSTKCVSDEQWENSSWVVVTVDFIKIHLPTTPVEVSQLLHMLLFFPIGRFAQFGGDCWDWSMSFVLSVSPLRSNGGRAIMWWAFHEHPGLLCSTSFFVHVLQRQLLLDFLSCWCVCCIPRLLFTSWFLCICSCEFRFVFFLRCCQSLLLFGCREISQCLFAWELSVFVICCIRLCCLFPNRMHVYLVHIFFLFASNVCVPYVRFYSSGHDMLWLHWLCAVFYSCRFQFDFLSCFRRIPGKVASKDSGIGTTKKSCISSWWFLASLHTGCVCRFFTDLCDARMYVKIKRILALASPTVNAWTLLFAHMYVARISEGTTGWTRLTTKRSASAVVLPRRQMWRTRRSQRFIEKCVKMFGVKATDFWSCWEDCSFWFF